MTFEFALRLFTAFACGVAIGLERDRAQARGALPDLPLEADRDAAAEGGKEPQDEFNCHR